jgi:hypothetical protein
MRMDADGHGCIFLKSLKEDLLYQDFLSVFIRVYQWLKYIVLLEATGPFRVCWSDRKTVAFP